MGIYIVKVIDSRKKAKDAYFIGGDGEIELHYPHMTFAPIIYDNEYNTAYPDDKDVEEDFYFYQDIDKVIDELKKMPDIKAYQEKMRFSDKQIEDWIDSNIDELVKKYEEKLKDAFKEEAERSAIENYGDYLAECEEEREANRYDDLENQGRPDYY